jgi:hypothetical protein
LDQDLRKRLGDVLTAIKQVKGNEEDKLGELLVSIEADLKRRLAE